MIALIKRKYTSLASDKRFAEVLTGSAFALVARIAGAGLVILSSIIVARVYGAEMMGILAIVQAFMIMAATLAVMGTNISILRLIPEHLAKYSVTSSFRVYRQAQYLVALGSILAGGVLFFSADLIAEKVFFKPRLTFYLAVTALCVIFKALMDLNIEAVRGLRLIRIFAFMQIFPHAAMLLLMLIFAIYSEQPNAPVYAQLAAWGITAMIGALTMDRAFRRRVKADDAVCSMPINELIALSTPMLMTASLNFIIGQIGVLVLGIYRPENEVGYYSVAVKLATLTSFVLQAINSMAAPKFSELFHTGRLDDLFYVARKSAKLIFWTTTPILLFLVLWGRPVLSTFGEGFAAAYIPMLILMAGQFVNSISGSTAYFMNMTGHQGIFRNIIATASIVNVLLSFALIPYFGLYGAALAGSASLALWNIGTLIYIKWKYHTTIGYLPFLCCSKN